MENRIKEQLMLFADRTSTSWLRSNQIRLYFSTVAYLLMQPRATNPNVLRMDAMDCRTSALNGFTTK